MLICRLGQTKDRTNLVHTQTQGQRPSAKHTHWFSCLLGPPNNSQKDVAVNAAAPLHPLANRPVALTPHTSESCVCCCASLR